MHFLKFGEKRTILYQRYLTRLLHGLLELYLYKFAINFVKSYLTGKGKIVKIGNSYSEEHVGTLGVLQGGNLNPLLFKFVTKC